LNTTSKKVLTNTTRAIDPSCEDRDVMLAIAAPAIEDSTKSFWELLKNGSFGFFQNLHIKLNTLQPITVYNSPLPYTPSM
jgi:hypothetical protein